jgi:hypothetical protein
LATEVLTLHYKNSIYLLILKVWPFRKAQNRKMPVGNRGDLLTISFCSFFLGMFLGQASFWGLLRRVSQEILLLYGGRFMPWVFSEAAKPFSVATRT